MDQADLFAIRSNQADFVGADVLVDAGASLARWGRVVRSAGYGITPSVMNGKVESAK